MSWEVAQHTQPFYQKGQVDYSRGLDTPGEAERAWQQMVWDFTLPQWQNRKSDKEQIQLLSKESLIAVISRRYLLHQVANRLTDLKVQTLDTQ